MKIVVSQLSSLSNNHIARLESLGDVTLYTDKPVDYDAWFKRVQNADVICSDKFGLKQRWQELSDTFISVPFVGVGWFDVKKAKQKNVMLARSPGCNKEAVAEWIIGMMINLSRDLPQRINATEVITESTMSLAGKTVCICGAGHIGRMVGEICEALHMQVRYFRRGDDLLESVHDASVIVDTLSLNEETEGIYNKAFFESLQKGSYFITVTSQKLWDVDALLQVLDANVLAGVATDCGGIQVDDTRSPLYKRMAEHSKVLATAHTAYNTDRRNQICNDMMIDNVEAWIAGKPINLVE